MPPKLSEVEGVDMPGEAAPSDRLRLKEGGIGVAMNNPETVVYVIRLIHFDPSTSTLLGWFQRDPPKTYMDTVGLRGM